MSGDEPELDGPKGFRSRFWVYRTAAYNVPNNNAVPIPFDTELYDSLGEMEIVGPNYAFRPRRAGFYLFTLSSGFAGPALAGTYSLRIELNNVNYIAFAQGELPAGISVNDSVSGIAHLEPGDFVQGWVFQVTGAVLAIQTASRMTSFQGHRLS